MSQVVVPAAPAVESISLSIASLRGQRVILDADLAALYGVQTKRFNEQVKRNRTRRGFRWTSCSSSRPRSSFL